MAGHLKKSVTEILELPSAEITYWLAYRVKNGPFDRSDLHQAMTCYTVAAAAGAKRVKPQDFLLQFGNEEPQQKPEMVWAFFRGLKRAGAIKGERSQTVSENLLLL